jgi:hypothetical protein
MTMSNLPDSHPADGPAMNGPQRAPRRTAVSRSEQKLAALRLALVQAKRQLHEASAREQSIREGTVGRAVWDLIEQGRLEPSVIALIRDEVRPALTPGRAAAFIGTVFELPAMPVGLVQEMEEVEVAAPLAEPDVPAVKRSPVARFGLPPRQTSK